MMIKPPLLRAPVLALCVAIMIGSTVVGQFLKPHKFWADFTGEPNFEQSFPHQFGEWKELPYVNRGVINPVTEESLKRIYSQTFARTFVNMRTGRAIMLSIAYGRDQTNDTQLHTPEQCYPSQGFRVDQTTNANIVTPFGIVKAVQMRTSLGDDRPEPLTFFVRVGDTVARGSKERNLERIKLALRGYLVDGTLVRVSEITRQDDAFDVQDQFLTDLLKALPAKQRAYLIGQSRT